MSRVGIVIPCAVSSLVVSRTTALSESSPESTRATSVTLPVASSTEYTALLKPIRTPAVCDRAKKMTNCCVAVSSLTYRRHR